MRGRKSWETKTNFREHEWEMACRAIHIHQQMAFTFVFVFGWLIDSLLFLWGDEGIWLRSAHWLHVQISMPFLLKCCSLSLHFDGSNDMCVYWCVSLCAKDASPLQRTMCNCILCRRTGRLRHFHISNVNQMTNFRCWERNALHLTLICVCVCGFASECKPEKWDGSGAWD